MVRDDFNGDSIVSQSVASPVPTIWSIVPLSLRTIPMRLDNLCSYLRATTSMERFPIVELIIRKEKGWAGHEFLLILLYEPSGGEFWVRLERKTRMGALHRLVWAVTRVGALRSVLEANDIVSALTVTTLLLTVPYYQATVSGDINSLLGKAKSVEKSKVFFHNRPSLRDLFYTLEALRQESTSYTLWPVWIRCSRFLYWVVNVDESYGCRKIAISLRRWLLNTYVASMKLARCRREV